MKTVPFPESSGTDYPVTQRHITEEKYTQENVLAIPFYRVTEFVYSKLTHYSQRFRYENTNRRHSTTVSEHGKANLLVSQVLL